MEKLSNSTPLTESFLPKLTFSGQLLSRFLWPRYNWPGGSNALGREISRFDKIKGNGRSIQKVPRSATLIPPGWVWRYQALFGCSTQKRIIFKGEQLLVEIVHFLQILQHTLIIARLVIDLLYSSYLECSTGGYFCYAWLIVVCYSVWMFGFWLFYRIWSVTISTRETHVTSSIHSFL